MKTIVAAVDFSPITPHVLKTACTLARAVGARLIVASAAVPAAIPAGPAALTLIAEIDAINEANKRSLQEKLREVKQSLEAGDLPVETVCFFGNAGGCITDHAVKIKPDYIVIGSHGHTAFYDLVVGSTAHVILRRAPCPVVIVPQINRTGHK